MTAAALLRSYSKPSLERMARQRRLETKGQNKEALINLLAPILFDADAIRRALVALSPVERRVLDEAVALAALHARPLKQASWCSMIGTPCMSVVLGASHLWVLS